MDKGLSKPLDPPPWGAVCLGLLPAEGADESGQSWRAGVKRTLGGSAVFVSGQLNSKEVGASWRH